MTTQNDLIYAAISSRIGPCYISGGRCVAHDSALSSDVHCVRMADTINAADEAVLAVTNDLRSQVSELLKEVSMLWRTTAPGDTETVARAGAQAAAYGEVLNRIGWRTMTDLPKNLLDLATDAVYNEEADHAAAFVDADHAPLIAAAALRPALDELRRQVKAVHGFNRDGDGDEWVERSDILSLLDTSGNGTDD